MSCMADARNERVRRAGRGGLPPFYHLAAPAGTRRACARTADQILGRQERGGRAPGGVKKCA
jgi:hypothetical protein